MLKNGKTPLKPDHPENIVGNMGNQPLLNSDEYIEEQSLCLYN